MGLTFATAPADVSVRPCPIMLLHGRDVPHADRLTVTGELVRVRRGVYANHAQWSALAPWDRYLTKVHAVLLVKPDAVACMESAASLQSMPVFGDPMTVHILDDALGSSRDVNGVRTHTSSNDRQIVDLGGIRVVGVIDTVIDLARARHRAIALSAADAALRSDRSLSAEMLVAANESRSSSRGRRQARWVTHRADPLAETPLESVSRAAIEWLGFDDPELQHTFLTEGQTDRSDMWWEGVRVVGESDGDVKYDGSLQSPADAIRGEKERDRRLRRHASAVAHWGWSDVLRVDPLLAELRRAGLRPRHSVDSRELYGLQDLTRRRS